MHKPSGLNRAPYRDKGYYLMSAGWPSTSSNSRFVWEPKFVTYIGMTNQALRIACIAFHIVLKTNRTTYGTYY